MVEIVVLAERSNHKETKRALYDPNIHSYRLHRVGYSCHDFTSLMPPSVFVPDYRWQNQVPTSSILPLQYTSKQLLSEYQNQKPYLHYLLAYNFIAIQEYFQGYSLPASGRPSLNSSRELHTTAEGFLFTSR